MPTNHLFLWCPLLLLTSVLPASGSFPVSQLFASGGQSIRASASEQSFEWIFKPDFLYDWLIWSPCSPKDSQEASPTSQFKSTNSSVLCFLYGPTLTSTHDYGKNHSFDSLSLLSYSVMSDSCDPMDCSLPGSSVHGILQARILEWVAILFSRVSSWPRYWTQVSCIADRFFTNWAMREALIPLQLWLEGPFLTT